MKKRKTEMGQINILDENNKTLVDKVKCTYFRERCLPKTSTLDTRLEYKHC